MLTRLRLVLAGLIVSSLAGAEPATPPDAAHLLVQNDSKVDIQFELTLDGKAVPGCFWALHGRSTHFALPTGKLRWSYAVGAMQFFGKLELVTDQPKMLKCVAWTNKYGQDDATCELGTPPEQLPAEDSLDVLADRVFGHLEAIAGAFAKKDAKALDALGSFPMDVEWRGKKPGKKRVTKAQGAIGLRASFALDAKTLAAVKAKRGAAKRGEDDCEKKVVDWEQGDAALSCKGQEVTVTLRAGPACDKTGWFDTWTLSNHSAEWRLFSKGVADGKAQTP